MGRKNLAVERREDILDAFEQCILERGIEGSSFQNIAQVLGMDRKIISHYFGNREALVDAMTQRIVDAFDSRMHEALVNLAPSAGFMALVDAFYGAEEATERTEILWTEIVAYATRSESVRDRLRQSYDKLFEGVGEILKREYPQASENQLQTAVYIVGTLLDRSPALEWIGVKGSPIKSAKVAIAKVLESLE
ncbi:MAG: TetR/AcrR family transcriptional regulator [Leptolyngbya sp. SIOISBB]|nr:TetR/AcrR family transcriptional regulator [Leptolyngbya sp. SIOISBB]